MPGSELDHQNPGTSEASTTFRNSDSFLSSLPEVSGLTIAVVASGCAILIVCLLLVLIFFCCRNRNAKATASSSDSDQFSHRDASSVERKVMSYMQYNGCDKSPAHRQLQTHQQQQYSLVSPHPSLTSTDETSVDQGSSKVFATMVSGSNPVTAAHTEGSESDHSHSGSLLQSSRQSQQQHQQHQHQRKIIYEVVV